MSIPVHNTDPLYPGEDQYVEADFSGFAELYTETGATVTFSIVAGSGFTPSGGATWNHPAKRAQQRGSVGALTDATSVLIQWHLVTTPNALDRIGYTRVPLEPGPTA